MSGQVMRTSERGVGFVAAHEGVVLRAYRDPVGIWTIGVGHTGAAGPPAVTHGRKLIEQSKMLLKEDSASTFFDVKQAFPLDGQTTRSGEERYIKGN